MRVRHRFDSIGLLLLSTSCAGGPSEPTQDTAENRRHESHATTGAALEVLRLRAVQLQGGPEYALREDGANHFVGVVPSIAASVRHEAAATHVVGSSMNELAMKVRGISCDGRFEPTNAATLSLDGHEVKRHHEGASLAFEEWLIGGPLGLEQGFTLNEDRGCKTTQIFVTVRGADVQQVGANELALSSRGAGYRLGSLLSADAEGRSLASTLEAEPEGFVITVETGAASFPVVIDPMLVSLQAAVTINAPGSTSDLSDDRFVTTSNLGTIVFRRTGVTWMEEATLPGGFNARIRGTTMAVQTYCNNLMSPCVRVYERTGNSWALQGELLPPDFDQNQGFGTSMAIDGDTIAVGINYDDRVFIFRRDSGGAWAPEQTLSRPDLDLFGRGVALEGNLLVTQGVIFGSASSVYTFTRQGTTWAEDPTVLPDPI